MAILYDKKVHEPQYRVFSIVTINKSVLIGPFRIAFIKKEVPVHQNRIYGSLFCKKARKKLVVLNKWYDLSAFMSL